jgi:hypothetical protein
LSFKELHKKYNRATPGQFQKYTTAVSLYALIKKEIPYVRRLDHSTDKNPKQSAKYEAEL